jgi:HEAT repeat protein
MLEQDIKRLADPTQKLTHKALRALSGLERTALAPLQAAWSGIPVQRRRQITAALVEMAEDDVEMDFVEVFRALLGDADATVRSSAVSGLWETDDESLIDPLLGLLGNDPAADVRAAAAESLGHFVAELADDPRHAGRAKRLLGGLLDALHSTNPANTDLVRRRALESAAGFGDNPQVVAAITESLSSTSPALRAGALSAMGNTFDAHWTPTVLDQLGSAEAEMRFEAARAAGDLRIEDAVPRLVAMTKDLDEEVQLMAIWALGEIGGLQAKATLTALLESHSEGVRDAAEEALAELRFNENPLDFADMFGEGAGRPGKKN